MSTGAVELAVLPAPDDGCVRGEMRALEIIDRLERLPALSVKDPRPGMELELPADIYGKVYECAMYHPASVGRVVRWLQKRMDLTPKNLSASLVYEDYGTDGIACLIRIVKRKGPARNDQQTADK